MTDKLTISDALEIEKYFDISVGFKEVRPDLCDPVNNPSIAFAVEQIRSHREWLENWMENNVEDKL